MEAKFKRSRGRGFSDIDRASEMTAVVKDQAARLVVLVILEARLQLVESGFDFLRNNDIWSTHNSPLSVMQHASFVDLSLEDVDASA
jgi:hypothetical protein